MAEVPPGPWRWERVDPADVYAANVPTRDPADDLDTHFREPVGAKGEGLVSTADGTILLSSDGGWGSPEIQPAVKALIAQLPDLMRQLTETREQLRLAQSWAWFRDRGWAPAEVLGDEPEFLLSDVPPWARRFALDADLSAVGNATTLTEGIEGLTVGEVVYVTDPKAPAAEPLPAEVTAVRSGEVDVWLMRPPAEPTPGPS